jgi:hypothetical protein
MPAIINRGDERCRDHRANARQFGEPAASFVRPANSEELRIELLQPAIKVAKLVEHIGEHRARDLIIRSLRWQPEPVLRTATRLAEE